MAAHAQSSQGSDAVTDDDIARPRSRDGHPVLWGLVALASVAVAVGLILGGGALVVTQALGFSGDSDPSSGSTAQESMFLPEPVPTQSDSGPLITLAPDPQGSVGSTSSAEPSDQPSQPVISLSVSQTSVAPMAQIDLTGTYPGGEGAILQVQQFREGGWTDFPVTASVGNETFATYIQTSNPGVNRFRVLDTDTREASNEVKVTIG